jgi:hypothetical protein
MGLTSILGSPSRAEHLEQVSVELYVCRNECIEYELRPRFLGRAPPILQALRWPVWNLCGTSGVNECLILHLRVLHTRFYTEKECRAPEGSLGISVR